MAAVAGMVGAVYMKSAGLAVPFTDATTVSNANYSRYTISDATKRYLDKTQLITVQVNGIEISSGYSLEYAGGVVIFNTPLFDTDVVTVDGSAWSVEQVAGCFNWKMELTSNVADTTNFESNQWKENKPTIKGWKASIEKYYLTNDIMNRLAEEVVLVLFVDAGVGQNRYEGYAYIEKVAINCSVDEIITESLEFAGREVYYREG